MQTQLSSHKKINHSSRSQHLISAWISTLHLYLNSNSSPLREVPISFSRTQIHQIASYLLHHQMDAPLRLPTYLTQGIKSTVVHWNELHQAQALVTESSATNRHGWVIWISSLPSWRTTAFNLSLSQSQTWDSCFFTSVVLSWFQWLQIIRHSHQCLQLVQHQNWLHDLHLVSHPVKS